MPTFTERVTPWVRVMLSLLKFGKDGEIFVFQWKMVTVLSPYSLQWPQKKETSEKVGFELFPGFPWFLLTS